MSRDVFQQAMKDKKIICPKCKNPVQQFDNFVDQCASVWDGAGDSGTEFAGSKVTLICGNEGCAWKERTEYWDSFMDE